MAFIGIPDDEFIRGDVPMTKEEIRMLTLAKARIAPDAVVWDVGAGTGSISVEAARLAGEGTVYAIERNYEGVKLIKMNAEKFGVKNLTAIAGEAPDALAGLPAPNSVIIGGSGRKVEGVLDVAFANIKEGGRVVLNSITVQTLADAIAYFRAKRIDYEAIQVQVSRFAAARPYDMAKALNPIFIVTGRKVKG